MPGAPHHPPPRDAVAWFDRQEPHLPPLTGTHRADVVVVGGGMMGLMCARALAAGGRHVCLLEAETCGAAASGRSSGFITPDSELELADLVRDFGPDDARRLWDFARGGVEAIRAAISGHRIACDYQAQDALFVAAKPSAEETVRKEHETRASLGYASVFQPRETLPAVLGADRFFGGIQFSDTFGIDAYRCCAGLRAALVQAGVEVFEQTRVTRFMAGGVGTPGGDVRADRIVVCTDRFLPALGLAPREIYHAQTFLALSEPLTDRQASRLFPAGPRMVWDTDLVYHYFRLTGDRRLLLGGGTLASTYARHEQHRPADVARRAAAYGRRNFPWLEARFTAAWPGLIGISKDFAPVVGRHPDHAHVHFAGGAAGLPWATALGGYLADKILEGRAELDALLTVNRRFAIGPGVQRALGAPAAFALAHGMAKMRR